MTHLGYTCSSCNTWVPSGTVHECTGNVSYYVQQPQYWSWPTHPYVNRFCGRKPTLDDLPNDATLGDAYTLADDDDLVVRTINGWHRFDKPTPESA